MGRGSSVERSDGSRHAGTVIPRHDYCQVLLYRQRPAQILRCFPGQADNRLPVSNVRSSWTCSCFGEADASLGQRFLALW
jgi:hypothetical protein